MLPYIDIFPRICDTLTMLDLSNNKLGEIPADISLLDRLEVLKINANRIVEVRGEGSLGEGKEEGGREEGELEVEVEGKGKGKEKGGWRG